MQKIYIPYNKEKGGKDMFSTLLISALAACLVSPATTPSHDCTDNCLKTPSTAMTEYDFHSDFNQSSVPSSTQLNFSATTYFQNLFEYSPINHGGSCGYVSFIQYLSYLDAFVNDSFIPESYERSQGNVDTLHQAFSVSPGVLRQSYSQTNLYSIIQENKSTDFQMYLMDIVNSFKERDQNQYSSGIGMWDYNIIINSLYSSSNYNFSYTRVGSFGTNAKPTDTNVVNWFNSYVKGKLDLGLSVILHIGQYDSSTNSLNNYHSVVAYYYDALGIHANFGWGSDSTDVVINSSYQITEAGLIDMSNVLVTHSNNYLVDGIEYCGYGIHNHRYIDHYCTVCADYTEEHDYHAPFVWVNYYRHRITCGCGATTLQPHSVASGSFVGGLATCLVCGGSAKMGFTPLSDDEMDSNNNGHDHEGISSCLHGEEAQVRN